MDKSDRLNGLGSRIEELIKVAGGVAPLSRAAGVSRASIDKWRKDGADPSTSNILALSDATKVTLEWLATGHGPKFRSENSGQASARANNPPYQEVPLYEAGPASERGSFLEFAEVKAQLPFSDDTLLRRLGRRSADGLICVHATGDAMEPLIRDGDLLLVDTTKTQLTPAIFAVSSKLGFWVRRLNPGVESVQAVCDNPAYEPMDIGHNAMHHFEILGRVIWVGHTL